MLQLCRKKMVAALVALASLSASCAHRQAIENRPAETVPVAELIAQADELYAGRGSIERARQAAGVLRRARLADYRSYDAIWKLSRCDYYLGTREPEEQSRLEAFREGITAGESAVQLADDRPEGHFWLGANLGGRAEEQGPLSALSSVADIRREMETVIRLDEGFQGGSAYLALGQMDLELPEMLGGDRKRAVAELERGLRFGADNALLRLRLAEAYYESKRRADARAQADAILKMKPAAGYQPEYDEAAEGARQMLEKLR
jgi:tetratricopeptide (TPR) repeat protein